MKNNPYQQPSTQRKESKIVFFIFWIILLFLLIPFYGVWLFLKEPEVKMLGLLGLIPQIIIFVISYRQANSSTPLSKAYLSLLGGSILVAFLWYGGCILMLDTSFL